MITYRGTQYESYRALVASGVALPPPTPDRGTEATPGGPEAQDGASNAK
jgi:hypothetical protein